MANYKQLCADLLDALIAHGQPDDAAVGCVEGLLARTRAALAEPEPEPPTDEELFAVAEAYAEDNGLIGLHNAPDHARAVLACWGNHPGSPDSSLQPVPVSERLPGPEDCDGEGTCWWWHPDHPESDYAGGWMQRPGQWGAVRYDSDGVLVYTHWLPAHALPLPNHE